MVGTRPVSLTVSGPWRALAFMLPIRQLNGMTARWEAAPECVEPCLQV